MEQKRRTSLLSLWATDKPVAVAVCHAMRDGQDHKDSKVNSGVQHLDSKIQASSQDSVTTLPRFGLQGLLSEGFVDFGCLLSGLRKERVHLHVSFPHARVRYHLHYQMARVTSGAQQVTTLIVITCHFANGYTQLEKSLSQFR